MTAEDAPRVHHEHGRPVQRRLGVHRVHEGNVIDAGGEVREQITDPFAALPVLMKLPARTDDAPLVAPPAATEGSHRHGAALKPVELPFVVEGFDMARPAVHEEEDDALRLRREVRRARRQRIDDRAGLGTDFVAGHQGGQADGAEACAGFPQELAPRTATELARHGFKSS